MTFQKTDVLCPNLKLYRKGKVREVYDFDDKLLIVVTDNVSIFDVVLPTLLPGKGAMLNKISNFWFEFAKNDIKNHLISTEISEFPQEAQEYADVLPDRSVLVWKTDMIEVEAIVRGYLSGSGYKDYLNAGKVCGIELPQGMVESAKLETPIFTPSTKAKEGHDMNISEDELKKEIGEKILNEVKEKALMLYTKTAKFALERGIIIADTKFEFGLLKGEVILIGGILTPDSSRFWPADDYVPGRSQKSYDKQIIRDYLQTLNWDKTYPGPELPDEVLNKTLQKYQEIFEKLSK